MMVVRMDDGGCAHQKLVSAVLAWKHLWRRRSGRCGCIRRGCSRRIRRMIIVLLWRTAASAASSRVPTTTDNAEQGAQVLGDAASPMLFSYSRFGRGTFSSCSKPRCFR